MACAGFQVVVDAFHACCSELLKLVAAQESAGNADGKMRFPPQQAHSFAKGSDFRIAEAAAGGDDGKALNAAGFALSGVGEDGFCVEQAVGVCVCGKMGGLCAKGAVFAAAAAFAVDDGAEIKAVALTRCPYAVCGGGECCQRRRAIKPQGIFTCDAAATQGVCFQLF